MANKKISELDQTLNLSDQADFPMSQDNGGEPTTFKAKLTQIAAKIAEAITFSNLKTGNKQLVSAVNQTISNLADDFNTTAGSTYAKDDCVLYNGILYQCTNSSGTTSGTFIDADWTAIKAVDVGSGGGGGSSTFEGLSDVSIDDQTLTNGQVPVYNSTTQKWENGNAGGGGASSADQVSVDDTDLAYEADDVQEALEKITKRLTYAEYKALTDAEKKNGTIYFITDVNGDGQSFQPVIYSEEEHEIGVWTDGKPLYEKTLNLNVTNSGDRFDISNLHIDTMIQVAGFIHQTGGNNPSVPYSSSSTDYALPYYSFSDDSIHVIFAGSYNQTTWVITVRYTKTTDTAGSGTWTPQGVPAHHYSEDEQVVGTWIDGSTIYEKTFDLGSETSISYNSWYNTGLTGFNKICDCFGLNNTGASYPLNASIQSDTLHLWGCRGTEVSIVRYLTLRYTKSST